MRFFVGLCFAVLMFLTAQARAGISTNGTSFVVDQNNVWNLGAAPVEYCVDTHRGFPLSRETTRRIVRESFDDWRKFFVKHGLDRMEFDQLPGGRALGLSLEFREVESCGESSERIRFVFGAITPEISKALEHQEHALGLTIRGDYDHESLRNGGIVWVRSSPISESAYKHLILHEVGHVFGMEHDSVYVMDSKTAENVSLRQRNQILLGQIESPTWPYRLRDGDTIDFTFIGRKSGNYEPNFLLPFLRETIEFAREGFHGVTLSVKARQGMAAAWDLKLAFKELDSGREAAFEGAFGIRPMVQNLVRGTRGPVLYTKWSCSACSPSGLSYARYLDPRPSGLAADGYFKRNGRVYPASLTPTGGQHGGLSLKMFVPEKSGWWTVDGYWGTSYLSP